jgi:hypothetical protein
MKIQLFILLLTANSLANDYIPPPPDNYPGNKWQWERAYKRCLQKPTDWARNRCIKDLYEG